MPLRLPAPKHAPCPPFWHCQASGYVPLVLCYSGTFTAARMLLYTYKVKHLSRFQAAGPEYIIYIHARAHVHALTNYTGIEHNRMPFASSGKKTSAFSSIPFHSILSAFPFR